MYFKLLFIQILDDIYPFILNRCIKFKWHETVGNVLIQT